MLPFARLTAVKTSSEAARLVVVYTCAAALMSCAGSGAQALALGTPVVAEILGGVLIALVIAPLLLWPLTRAALALHAREIELERQANTDSMTGALNRRGFFVAAAPLFEDAAAAPLSVLLLDIDFFKTINDTYGHAAGDEVVKAAARTIADLAASRNGVVGRIGGDEFCVLFARTDVERAMLFSERLRAEMESRIIRHDDRAIRITVSIGLATRRADDSSFDDFLARADAALYAAKSQGRNRASADAAPTQARRRA